MPSHPPIKKCVVQPIQQPGDIERVRDALKTRPRDLLLFDLLTRSGAGLKAILNLRAAALMPVAAGDRLMMDGAADEGIPVDETTYLSIQYYLSQVDPVAEDYVFGSRKGSGPLRLPSVTRLVKSWFEKAGLDAVGGVRSLRKTFERHFQSAADGGQGVRRITNDLLEPVKVTTAQDAVFNQLLQAIVSGRIRPGETLLIRDVARRMALSRFPVRSAFARLEALGWITTRKNKGSVVNELSERNLKELLEIRLVNESMAAGKAAVDRRPETVAQLEKLHVEYIRACEGGDVDWMLSLNKQFHYTMYRDADMPVLQTLIAYLWDRTSPYLHMLMRQTELPLSYRDIAFHQKMLLAMKTKDGDGVVRWLQTDMQNTVQMIMELFSYYKGGKKDA